MEGSCVGEALSLDSEPVEALGGVAWAHRGTVCDGPEREKLRSYIQGEMQRTC